MKAFVAGTALSLMMTMPPRVTQAAPLEYEIPVTDILAAAQAISPRMGSVYRAEGLLHCWVLPRGQSPFSTLRGCEVLMNERSEQFRLSQELLTVLKKTKSSEDGKFETTVRFRVDSINVETPPYYVFQRAVIYID